LPVADLKSCEGFSREGTVKLALDLGIAAQYVAFGTVLDPNLLGVRQLDFGQLDNTL